jgi:acyl carrier protein
MSAMNTNEVIRNFIENEILQQTLSVPLGDNDQLVETGIIDSLGVMTLLSFLEEKFSIQIPGDDLVPENFSSISTIAALVERHQVH